MILIGDGQEGKQNNILSVMKGSTKYYEIKNVEGKIIKILFSYDSSKTEKGEAAIPAIPEQCRLCTAQLKTNGRHFRDQSLTKKKIFYKT